MLCFKKKKWIEMACAPSRQSALANLEGHQQLHRFPWVRRQNNFSPKLRGSFSNLTENSLLLKLKLFVRKHFCVPRRRKNPNLKMVLLSTVLLLNMFCTYYDCSYHRAMPTIENRNEPPELSRLMSPTSSSRNLKSRMIDLAEVPEEKFPIVVTKTGVLQGYQMKVSNGRDVYAFEGVPYAEPPGRFRVSYYHLP